MTNPFIKVFHQNQHLFRTVVPFDAGTDKIVRLDFTESNTTLTPAVTNDIRAFENYINRHLDEAAALYGIGGYNEHRTMYSRSTLFNSGDELEPRRLHLGIDIWGKTGTTIAAPLDAVVHSYANNMGSGDYGATIILSHALDGIHFHTLYGHLSRASIENLAEGQAVRAGEVFATFGDHTENGYWPPHLHFQVVLDMQGRKGDYPGVCRFSERDSWLQNSPDADLILNLNKFSRPA